MIIWPNHLFSDRISSIYKVVLDGWPSGLCTNTSNKLFSCKAAYFTSKEHCLKTFLIINLDLFHHNFWLIPAIIPLQLPLIIWVSQLHDHPLNIFFSFIFMFDFIERRREGKREGENTDVRDKHWSPFMCTLAGHRTHNLLMCPYQESNWKPLNLWEDIQPTEPHKLGQHTILDKAKEI